jgi:hypothetical protein
VPVDELGREGDGAPETETMRALSCDGDVPIVIASPAASPDVFTTICLSLAAAAEESATVSGLALRIPTGITVQ